MTDRTPIKLPPGVVRQGSPAEMSGHWYEVNLIRWIGGVMRPVAGWDRIVTKTAAGAPFAFASKVRKTHVWMTRDGITRTAVFCERHLYVVSTAGEVTDITPTDGIAGPEDPTIGGWGDGLYDTGIYDNPRAPRPNTGGNTGSMWTLDNFGDNLLAMSSTDARLLVWDPTTPGTKAARAGKVTGPPVSYTSPFGRFFIVTPERHVMVFQDGDAFNRMNWCSQEDINDWDLLSLTNSAGMYEIEPAQPFVTGISTRYGVIAFTTGGIYLFNYVGTPYFYSYNYLGDYAAPVTGDAITAAADTVVWYASDGFWRLQGGSSVSALPCAVLDWIQNLLDPDRQYERPCAIYNGHQSEMWFFFPQKNAAENTHYAMYNFDDGWWSMGRLSRTCGTPGSALSNPIMSDGVNLYRHERGLFYYDVTELPYAKTAAINIAEGGRQATIRKGIVDTRAPAEDVVFTVGATKERISDGTSLENVEMRQTVRRDGGKLDFRVTGRDMYIKIESARNGVQPWTFGQMLVAIAPRGGR